MELKSEEILNIAKNIGLFILGSLMVIPFLIYLGVKRFRKWF